jgi:hypothetical protein
MRPELIRSAHRTLILGLGLLLCSVVGGVLLAASMVLGRDGLVVAGAVLAVFLLAWLAHPLVVLRRARPARREPVLGRARRIPAGSSLLGSRAGSGTGTGAVLGDGSHRGCDPRGAARHLLVVRVTLLAAHAEFSGLSGATMGSAGATHCSLREDDMSRRAAGRHGHGVELPPVSCDDQSWHALCARVVEVVPGCRHASVTVRFARRRLVTVGWSFGDPYSLDRIQVALGEDPTLDALQRGTARLSPDVRIRRRWPRWERAIGRLGMRAVASVPLHRTDGPPAALTLYSDRRCAFGKDLAGLVSALAPLSAG